MDLQIVIENLLSSFQNIETKKEVSGTIGLKRTYEYDFVISYAGEEEKNAKRKIIHYK